MKTALGIFLAAVVSVMVPAACTLSAGTHWTPLYEAPPPPPKGAAPWRVNFYRLYKKPMSLDQAEVAFSQFLTNPKNWAGKIGELEDGAHANIMAIATEELERIHELQYCAHGQCRAP